MINNFLKYGLSVLSCIILTSFNAWAVQYIEIDDSGKFSANISKLDANRIKIENDRIKTIKANSNELDISVEGKLGEVYIKPTEISQNKPISAFIITEKNSTYQALFFPKSIPSEQIIIKGRVSSSNSRGYMKYRGLKNSYKGNIVDLITAMRRGEDLEGYSMRKRYRKVDLGDLKIIRRVIYKSQYLVGEIYILKNKTKKILSLKESIFFKNGVKAVKIEKINLLPKEETRIFIVS